MVPYILVLGDFTTSISPINTSSGQNPKRNTVVIWYHQSSGPKRHLSTHSIQDGIILILYSKKTIKIQNFTEFWKTQQLPTNVA